MEKVIAEQSSKGESSIPGTTTFTLYDTYGFPIELTEEYAEEANMTVDHEGFKKEMEAQRNRARAARQNVDSMQVQSEVYSNIIEVSEFVGYDTLTVTSKITSIIHGDALVKTAHEGDEIKVILSQTPFYAESGGQVADHGTIENDTFRGFVKDVQKAPNGQNLHTVIVESGEVTTGSEITATVDRSQRGHTVKNHSATHILHQALKDVLGTHVNQAGSYVGPDRLRFDFSHFGQVTKEELEKIERIVNEKVWENIPVVTSLRNIDEAKQMGAMALFGEKYGDVVRVVQMGEFSLELCGGIHVFNTSEIGFFKLLSESGIGAGTRRIEAVTGKGAFEVIKQEEQTLVEAANQLKAQPKDLVSKVALTLIELKNLQKENESLSAKIANSQASSVLSSAQKVNDITVLSVKVDAKDNNQLRQMMDDLKQKLESAVIVLGAVDGDKVMISAGVTKDLVGGNYHAGNIVKLVAEQCGGKGGGRPDFAMAGAKDGI